MMTSNSNDRLDRDTLIATFHSFKTPRKDWRVGGEFERAVVRPDGQPVGYDDPDGIRFILEQLAQRDGWDKVRENGQVIALSKINEVGGTATITLEPGGQIELSGAPHRSLAALEQEMHENRNALLAIAENHNLRWIAAGLTPIASMHDITWMPKGRYQVMRDYLPQYGDLALHMMKGTCSVQCNFDYRDEMDCAAKVRLCSGLSALTTAIFSNSPLSQNRPNGFKSFRGHIWTRTDPARCGFPPGLRDTYTHEKWVDYLLDVPMMFYCKDDIFLPAHGRSFRSFMEQGIDGHFPNATDWALHQTSVFPEVRIKHTIEVRGADCVNHNLALAFCAIFTGLLYCDTALDEGLSLVKDVERFGTHAERFDIACRDGLGGTVGGRTLGDWASDLGEIAERGLRACLPKDEHLLTPLLEQIESGRSPAQDLLDAWARDPSPESVIRAAAY